MISIIVPVYNAAKTLKRCIDSVVNQTYSDLELVLVDDGSKDGSAEICRAYSLVDSRIRYYYQENSGVSAARNYGIDVAKGEYLMFLDADDYYHPAACESLMDAVKLDADIIVGGYDTYFTDKKLFHTCYSTDYHLRVFPIRECFELLTIKGYIHPPWNKLYRKDWIKKVFNVKKSMGEDMEFIISNVDENTQVGFTCRTICCHDISSDKSLSKKWNLVLNTIPENERIIRDFLIREKMNQDWYNNYIIGKTWGNLIGLMGNEKRTSRFSDVFDGIHCFVRNQDIRSTIYRCKASDMKMKILRLIMRIKSERVIFCAMRAYILLKGKNI